jgi:hypothetical protein
MENVPKLRFEKVTRNYDFVTKRLKSWHTVLVEF